MSSDNSQSTSQQDGSAKDLYDRVVAQFGHVRIAAGTMMLVCATIIVSAFLEVCSFERALVPEVPATLAKFHSEWPTLKLFEPKQMQILVELPQAQAPDNQQQAPIPAMKLGGPEIAAILDTERLRKLYVDSPSARHITIPWSTLTAHPHDLSSVALFLVFSLLLWIVGALYQLRSAILPWSDLAPWRKHLEMEWKSIEFLRLQFLSWTLPGLTLIPAVVSTVLVAKVLYCGKCLFDVKDPFWEYNLTHALVQSGLTIAIFSLTWIQSGWAHDLEIDAGNALNETNPPEKRQGVSAECL